MTREPLILESETIDAIEDVVDALADGSGIGIPSGEQRDYWQDVQEELEEERARG